MIVLDHFPRCVHPFSGYSRVGYGYGYPLFSWLGRDTSLLAVGLSVKASLGYLLVSVALGVVPKDTVALVLIELS